MDHIEIDAADLKKVMRGMSRVRRPQPLRGAHVDYLRLTLPWPPSLNRYYRNVKGVVKISQEGRKYREAVGKACLQCGHLEGRLYLSVDVYPPDKRQRDLDNLLKGLLDSLQAAGLFESDSQIDVLRVERREVHGKVVITLWELSDEE